MIKNHTVLEIIKGEKRYTLMMDSASTLGEIYDVLCEMRGMIFQKIQEVEKKENQEKKDD